MRIPSRARAARGATPLVVAVLAVLTAVVVPLQPSSAAPTAAPAPTVSPAAAGPAASGAPVPVDDHLPVTPQPQAELAPQIVCQTGCVGGNATHVPSPSIALIVFNGSSSCTGVVVGARWVLTAAHCLVQFSGDNPTTIPNPLTRLEGSVTVPNYKVYVGIANGASPTSVTPLNGDLLVVNPGYLIRSSAEDVPGFRRSDQTWEQGIAGLVNDPGIDDFGLIRLDSAVDTNVIRPISLTVDDSLAQSGQVAWGAGWGLTVGGGTALPNQLQEAQMVVQNSTFCEIIWRSVYSAASNVCYGSSLAATCNGDSGGPILTQDDKGAWWLDAIVTGGPNGCPVNQPYVGVRAAWMASFVTQHTGVAQLGRFGESFNPIVPVRIVDSRLDPPNGLGVDFIPPTVDDPRALGIFKPVPKLPTDFVVRRPLYSGPTAVGGLPVGNLAGVVLNVTVEGPEAGGFVTVYPCADGAAPTSNLNFVAGQTVANLVVTKVDRNGDVCFRTAARTALIADVLGWLGPQGGDKALVGTSPIRLLDTRETVGRLAAGQTVALQVTGPGKAPAGVAGAVLNLTSTNTGAPGFVTAWPCDAPLPLASNMNPVPGRDLANATMVKLDGSGQVCLYTASATDLVVDLNGWFAAAGSGSMKTLTPQRIVDTRPSNALAGEVPRAISVLGVGGVPASGVDSVILNVTITEPVAGGYALVWPCASPQPFASNLNYNRLQTVPNAVVAKVDGSGQVCVMSTATAHLIVDVTGYVRAS